jgi:beta-1,4-mannosyl-glycoprotein beta-1,4-N-acetylglucosaminyltransferase
MAKVFDVFTFFNEVELLQLRLEMLNDHVDCFVIVECVETFSGNPKPLYFEQNKHLFEKYLHKIYHHVTLNPPKSFEDLQERIVQNNYSHEDIEKQICLQALTTSNVPKGELHWLKEFYQKEYIRSAIEKSGAQDEDLCFVGDLDEIWNTELDYRIIDDYSIYKLKQLVYVGYLNNRSNEDWAGTLLTRYRNIKGSCLNHLRTPSKTSYTYIDNAGWHFSFMGGEERVKLKIESYGHQEFNNDQVKSQVTKNLDSGRDILGRPQFYYRVDESDLPRYLIENKEKYKQFFK